jgi:hypothetical protein
MTAPHRHSRPGASRRWTGPEQGEGAPEGSAALSPAPACIICDGPAEDIALLADNDRRPIAMIAMCADCLALADTLGLDATHPTGKA